MSCWLGMKGWAVSEGKKLVPKLRFPEFRDAENWALEELGDYLDYVQPTPYLVRNTAYDDKYKIPVVTAGKTFVLGHTNETEGVFEDALPVIIFDDFTTASQFVDFKFKAKSSAMKILLAKENANIRFMYEAIQQIDYEVGAHGRHWISSYSKIKIPVPDPIEQQKIADCLSSVDELIAAQARKVDAIKTHKKGLMQQLFQNEGETLPRLRFPEFRDSPKWADERLGKHVAIRSGNSPSTFVLSSSGRYPYVKVEDLNNCTKYQTTGREYCNDSEGVVPKHSLVFPKRGAAIELNKIRITESQIQIDTNLMAITPKEGLATEFLFYYISNFGLAHIADTSTIPQINNKHIVPFVVRRPSVAEQQRIAEFLSSLDAQIAAETDKLDSLKTYKKGLMQQLFPSPENVAA